MKRSDLVKRSDLSGFPEPPSVRFSLVITGKVITLEMGPGYQKAKNTIGPDLKSGRSLDPKISRSLAQDVVQCISRFSFSSDLST